MNDPLKDPEFEALVLSEEMVLNLYAIYNGHELIKDLQVVDADTLYLTCVTHDRKFKVKVTVTLE